MIFLRPLPESDHAILNENLERIAAMLETVISYHQATTLSMTFGARQPAGTEPAGGEAPMQQLGDSEQIEATCTPIDRAGNPAQVEAGTVVWSSSDETIATVAPDPTNELKATVTAVGPLGTATITVSADADLGSGIATITDTADVEIVAGQAANLGLGFGAPTPKP